MSIQYSKCSSIYISINNIQSNMIQQIIVAQNTDQYYFRLKASYLNIKMDHYIKSGQNNNQVFRLQLVKDQKLIDKTKQIKGYLLNGKMQLENGQLNFCMLSYSPKKGNEYILTVLKKIEESDKEEEIGRYIILPGVYIKKFRSRNTQIFNQEIDLSNDYSLSLDIFMSNNRYALQKLTKENRAKSRKAVSNNSIQKQEKARQSQIVRKKVEQNSGGNKIRQDSIFVSPKKRKIERKNLNSSLKENQVTKKEQIESSEQSGNALFDTSQEKQSKTVNKYKIGSYSSSKSVDDQDILTVSSYGWNQSIHIRKTDSLIQGSENWANYPNQLNVGKQFDIKTKVMCIVLAIISILLILSVMFPSKKV